MTLVSVRSVLLMGLLSVECGDSTVPLVDPPLEITDAQLFELQQAPVQWKPYKFRNDTLARAGNSAHPDRIYVRYNPAAATQLDTSGRILPAASFPDSSLIVKEVFTGSTRTVIAYMFKRPDASNAGPNGWVWAETRDDGTPLISASLKGGGCVPCHSVGIDYTRMSDAHP
jgi:hypothetical protein